MSSGSGCSVGKATSSCILSAMGYSGRKKNSVLRISVEMDTIDKDRIFYIK